MCSVATKDKNPRMRTKIWNLADFILKAGDFAYNELRKYINEFYNLSLPVVSQSQSLSELQLSFAQNSQTHIDYLVKYNHFGLTEKEIQCIYWTRFGKNANEIASILYRSAETIKTHLKNARSKMGCSTLSQLTAEAINCGLIK